MPFLRDVGILAVQLLFGIALFVLALRLLLPLSGARFSNPICQFIYKITNPLIGPLTRYLPPLRKLSIATLALAWVVALVEFALLFALVGLPFSPLGLLLGSLGGLVYYLVGIAFWAIVIRALLSFFSPDYGNPLVEILFAVTDPLLRPFRKLPPRLPGIDLSPMYAGFVLRVAMLAIQHLLLALGLPFLPL